MASPQDIAQEHPMHNERCGLGVVDDNQIGFDLDVLRIRGESIQIGFEEFLERNRLVYTLERIVKFLGDLEEGVVALNGGPAGLDP